jgi:alpha-ketoglutarate-dependent taurine dioxygenase
MRACGAHRELGRLMHSSGKGWLGAEFDRGALYWDFTPAQLAAIDELMTRLGNDARPFHAITKDDFSHPALDTDLAALLRTIKTGPGIVIIRGFPVDKYTPEEMQTVYWGVGAHFGRGCSQSADGDYLGHVTNVAKASRGYTTDRELSLHTDSAEIVGLLCVRGAKEGGMSIYASSPKVHEIIARERPDYLPVLERGFRCDRRGEEAAEDDPVTPYRVPVFSEEAGLLSTRYVRGVIDRGAEALGQPLSDGEREALAFFENVAQRDEVRLELTLRPGEASFINNYEMLHARTGFVDHDDPAKKRLLYRLWLMGDPPRPMKKEAHLYQNRSGMMGVDPQPGRGPR